MSAHQAKTTDAEQRPTPGLLGDPPIARDLARRRVRASRARHPDPNGAPDRTPIEVGEVWENPVTGERSTILELPYKNPEGRASVELIAVVGARVAGEHRHPALVERFTVLEGELTLKLDGRSRRAHGTIGGTRVTGMPGYGWRSRLASASPS
jgi:hypothetical protein